MKIDARTSILLWLGMVLFTLLPISSTFGSPFDEEAEAIALKKYQAYDNEEHPPLVPMTAAEVNDLLSSGGYLSGPGVYATRLLRTSFNQTSRGIFDFEDHTANNARLAWFEKVMAEHGCRIISEQDSDEWQGPKIAKSYFHRFQRGVDGRMGILSPLLAYYGGRRLSDTITGIPDPKNHDNPELTAELDAEREVVQGELAILRLEIEYDQILRKLESGSVEARLSRSADRERLVQIVEKEIPARKAALNNVQGRIDDAIRSLAASAEAAGDTGKAEVYKSQIRP